MQKTSTIRNFFLIGAIFAVLLLNASCAGLKDNSDRSLQELANHMITQVGGTLDGKVFPVPVKAALAMMGKIEEVYRLPLCQLSVSDSAKLRETMLGLGLIGQS